VKQFRDEGGEGKPTYGQLHVCWAEDEAEARKTAHRIWPNAAITGGYMLEMTIPARFEEAAERVMHWGMQRGSGLKVQPSSELITAGAVVVVKIGFLKAPCRVVYVVDEPHVRGFAYGTLPGHPESGEERFVVRHDPVTSAVFAEVSAFSRPATWWSRAGGPFTSLIQRVMNKRYVRAV